MIILHSFVVAANLWTDSSWAATTTRPPRSPTTGIMVIFDAPDAISAGAVAAAASASGAFQNVQIKRLLTQEETVSVLKKAQGVLTAFSPPKG